MHRTSVTTAAARRTLIGAAVTRNDVVRPLLSLLLLLLTLSSLVSPVMYPAYKTRDTYVSSIYAPHILFCDAHVAHARRACVMSTLIFSPRLLARARARIVIYTRASLHTSFYVPVYTLSTPLQSRTDGAYESRDVISADCRESLQLPFPALQKLIRLNSFLLAVVQTEKLAALNNTYTNNTMFPCLWVEASERCL